MQSQLEGLRTKTSFLMTERMDADQPVVIPGKVRDSLHNGMAEYFFKLGEWRAKDQEGFSSRNVLTLVPRPTASFFVSAERGEITREATALGLDRLHIIPTDFGDWLSNRYGKPAGKDIEHMEGEEIKDYLGRLSADEAFQGFVGEFQHYLSLLPNLSGVVVFDYRLLSGKTPLAIMAAVSEAAGRNGLIKDDQALAKLSPETMEEINQPSDINTYPDVYLGKIPVARVFLTEDNLLGQIRDANIGDNKLEAEGIPLYIMRQMADALILGSFETPNGIVRIRSVKDAEEVGRFLAESYRLVRDPFDILKNRLGKNRVMLLHQDIKEALQSED